MANEALGYGSVSAPPQAAYPTPPDLPGCATKSVGKVKQLDKAAVRSDGLLSALDSIITRLEDVIQSNPKAATGGGVAPVAPRPEPTIQSVVEAFAINEERLRAALARLENAVSSL